jgi:protocatechuate 3,4-dioxygenase beta subunit
VISPRLRQWLTPALLFAAMLVLPALSWIVIPRPPVFTLPPATGATTTSVEAPPPVAATPSPTPRAAVTHRPRATASAGAAAEVEPVAGVVLDPDGHPMKAALVTCSDREPALATSTDDEGRFVLVPEAAGCSAIAQHPEFFPSERVVLSSGKGNSVRLARGATLEGDVVDDRGAPVASYTLGIESYVGPSDRAPSGQSRPFQDPRGAFSWDKLPAGRYVLTASAEGRPHARSASVEVEAGRTSARVHLTMARGATLSGRVLDAATRKPLAGATVAFDASTLTRGAALHSARSDEQGAYSLEGAPDGPFSVRVSREGYRARVVTGLTTHGAPTLQQDVELNAIVDGGPTGDDFAGVGAFLEASPKGVSFARLVPDGPAEKAGIKPGDVIRRIDGADAATRPLVDCMQSLRGPDGTRVSVEVDRGGQRVDVTIQRRALTL